MHLLPAAGAGADADKQGTLAPEPSTEDFLLLPVPNSATPREVPAVQHVDS